MEDFLKDLKHSLRMFRQNAGFTFAAVAALVVGIAANTAIFSVVNSILLKPPPFPEAERIVLFMNTSPEGQGTGASPAKFNHWRAQSAVVESVSAFSTGVINLTSSDIPEQLRSGRVTADFFGLFGAPIIEGRGFNHEEDMPNGPRVALISEGLWQRRFGRAANILGKTIQLGGDTYDIIGIVGNSFDFRDFGPQPEVWVPFPIDPNTTDQGHYFNAGGRVKAGVTVQQARAQIAASAAEYIRKYPGALGEKGGFSIETVQEALIRDVRKSLMVLAAAVGLVLLIACANVANLLLARSIARKREIAIRAAIGAGRGRLIRQMLTESLLLSLTGAVLGSLVGIGAIRALLTINTANLPRIGEKGELVGVDWRVLVFTVGVAVVTAILFGLIPALQSSRADLGATLKESGGRSGSGFRQNKARTILVVTEIALAVVLVIGAALLIRTSLALASVNPGFDPHNVLTMRMSLAGGKYKTSAAIEQLMRDGTDRIKAIPGVETATAGCCIPLEGGFGLPFRIMGRPLDNSPFHGGGGWYVISANYFDVFRIPVKRGRAIVQTDNGAGPPVVVINEAMAKKFWPKGDPLNDRILIGKGVMKEFEPEVPRQIVGIIGDIRDGGLNSDPGPAMYVASAQVPDAVNALNVNIGPIAWLVRTRTSPGTLSAAIQEQLRQASGLPISDIKTMDEVVSRSTSRERFNMLLMSIFGASALLLAAIGVYGLMTYSVQQRTQEIGIRIALGAESADVLRMVVFQGMTFSLAGVAVGTAAAFGLAKLIASFLFGVEARDPMVFAVVPAVLTVIAFFAIVFPAMRATKVHPMTALRYE